MDHLHKRKSANNVALAISQDLQRSLADRGQQLPPERILAEQHQISRGTLRAALSILENQAVIIRKPGNGTFVNQLPNHKQMDFADITSPGQLMDVRAIFEPAIVEMAVKNATHRDIKRISEAFSQLQASREPKSFSYADEAFHLCIAKACGNPLLLWIYEQINEIRQHEMWRNSRKKVLSETAITTYNQHHETIFTAITERNIPDARQAILLHLQTASDDLVR
ncbi:MAG: FadR family transcriptional regulator [Gammaproteobacteria bacterium]|jgi:DNA-binding FadR family transcriptional regulator|nr:FadR family transcriptional regulator [Gammaproteobacteria bacterium]MCP4880037.1 FadR family transcriptional regulator [Gammaproteobacteria bacterium]MDP6165874.1 FCD domain-containing protein [Gammaproteobacteria bacterium]